MKGSVKLELTNADLLGLAWCMSAPPSPPPPTCTLPPPQVSSCSLLSDFLETWLSSIDVGNPERWALASEREWWGEKTGWEPAGFASAHVSTGAQNSGRNPPCGGEKGPVPGLRVTLFWKYAHDTERRRRAPIDSEDVCHLQRNAPTKPASVRRGLLPPRGSVFMMCGENVTQVRLLELK